MLSQAFPETGNQIGPRRLLDEVRAEARPTAEGFVWRPEDDGMYLEVEWPDGECSRYLWSSLDARYVHPVADA